MSSLWFHGIKTATHPQTEAQQKEGLITRKQIHYLGPPGYAVKRQIGPAGPENGRYLGKELTEALRPQHFMNRHCQARVH